MPAMPEIFSKRVELPGGHADLVLVPDGEDSQSEPTADQAEDPQIDATSRSPHAPQQV